MPAWESFRHYSQIITHVIQIVCGFSSFPLLFYKWFVFRVGIDSKKERQKDNVPCKAVDCDVWNRRLQPVCLFWRFHKHRIAKRIKEPHLVSYSLFNSVLSSGTKTPKIISIRQSSSVYTLRILPFTLQCHIIPILETILQQFFFFFTKMSWAKCFGFSFSQEKQSKQ